MISLSVARTHSSCKKNRHFFTCTQQIARNCSELYRINFQNYR